jgi:putative FmdB family regulatory protein
MPIYDYKCEDGHYTEDFQKMKDCDEPTVCSVCGKTAKRIFGRSAWAVDRFGERFPYFDRGLGMELRSKDHRRQVMKQKGLVAVDGDFSISDNGREKREQAAKESKMVEKLHHDMKHHPAFKLYREQKSRGWKPNFKHRSQR